MKKNEKNLEKQKYNIGLDIGTTSVGWAVTDLENNLLKIKGKNMWGSRIFEEASSAEKTRIIRCSKRRLKRRKERIKILQQLIGIDVIKEYPEFFLRLKESSLTSDDKKIDYNVSKKYNLFSDLNMNDEKYYFSYPTIYHLRKHLVRNKQKEDIRLVYLAIHHILKYRGNFLYEGQDLGTISQDISENLENIVAFLKNQHDGINFENKIKDIIDVLEDKTLKKSEKKDELMSLFIYDKEGKSVVDNCIKALIGYSFEFNKIFNINYDEKIKIDFSKENEKEDEVLKLLSDEEINIYELLKKIYNWVTFKEILKGKNFISEAFIIRYNKYKNDLQTIKKLYKEISLCEYNDMFKVSKIGKNYYTYDKNISECSIDDLYKEFRKVLDKEKEVEGVKEVLEEIQNRTFLRKLNTTDNASIPYQLHYKELKEILDNQSKYYSEIEKNKDKILQLMTFRIPYYVGPLTKNDLQSRFSWVKRKSEDKIFPWNFEEIIDVEESAEEFIKRMTKKCTYLINEDVLPKNSIVYLEFCLLNELANIRINGQKIPKELKMKLIEGLFGKTKKVTISVFKKFLIDNQEYKDIKSISGLSQENEFNTQLISYIDMSNIFEKINKNNINMIEEIIEWITLFEDKKILKRKLKKYQNEVSEEQINKLLKLRYKGWGNLSRKLLVELKSVDNKESIIDKLRNTELNFIQIINKEKFGYMKQIEALMPKLSNEVITYNDIENLQGSPSIKKAIWQTVKVVKEIVKIRGCEPENIFIEFARGEDRNKTRNDKRAEKLKKIYETIIDENNYLKDFDKQVYKELKNKMDEKDFNEKLFLYFIQNGKCLYTQQKLDIDRLYIYDVDHILPQSYIKDNSFSNKALVIKEENQRKSDSLLLNDDIINNRKEWWESLHKSGLMDLKKFKNLIRRSISPEQREMFINRQLVETRQIIKHVTNLFINQYINTEIFAIRAELTSSFRKKYELYKSRDINNYHHAQDALFTIIIGNISKENFYCNNEFKYDEYLKKYDRMEEKEKYRRKNTEMILSFIEAKVDGIKLKNIMNYKDCFITKKLEEQTGEFYNQSIYKKGCSKAKINVKNNRPVEIYGGKTGNNSSYYVIAKYIDLNSKEEIKLIGIPIKIAYDIKKGKVTEKQYIEGFGYKNVEILKNKMLKYQVFLNEEKEKMILTSSIEVKINKSLILDYSKQRIIYQISNFEKLTDKEKEYIQEEINNLYNYLILKIKSEFKTMDNQSKKLEENMKKFMDLGFKDKKGIIFEILKVLKGGEGNLEKVGMGNRVGRIQIKNFDKTKLINMIFIDYSVTGIFERRYGINGLEDNCNKK